MKHTQANLTGKFPVGFLHSIYRGIMTALIVCLIAGWTGSTAAGEVGGTNAAPNIYATDIIAYGSIYAYTNIAVAAKGRITAEHMEAGYLDAGTINVGNIYATNIYSEHMYTDEYATNITAKHIYADDIWAWDISASNVTANTDVTAHGDVKLGTSGQYFAAAAEESLRIVRGTVKYSGVRAEGAGFTIVKTGVGAYQIIFNVPFSGRPSVVAGPSHAYTDSAPFFVTVSGPVTNYCFINIFNIDGDRADYDFAFIAMGPR